MGVGLMNHESTQSTTIEIKGGFTLVAANPSVFVNHYTIYKNSNPFNRFSWEHHLYAITDKSPCYWIFEGGKRIGGVLMRPNLLTGLFLEPPFTDINRVVGILATTVREWSDPTLPIRAYGIVQWQYEAFTRHGFRLNEGKRNMIRPTEVLPYEFADEFEVITASAEYETQAAELLNAAFSGGAGLPMSLEQHVDTARTFYGTLIKKSEVMEKASSLVFDRFTGELVALCHVIEWEGWPMIDDIVVRPQYQGRGLATALLRKAISEVAPHYPAMRLFVTVGNPAQSVYYNLGFLPAPEFYELEIPAVCLS